MKKSIFMVMMGSFCSASMEVAQEDRPTGPLLASGAGAFGLVARAQNNAPFQKILDQEKNFQKFLQREDVKKILQHNVEMSEYLHAVVALEDMKDMGQTYDQKKIDQLWEILMKSSLGETLDHRMQKDLEKIVHKDKIWSSPDNLYNTLLTKIVFPEPLKEPPKGWWAEVKNFLVGNLYSKQWKNINDLRQKNKDSFHKIVAEAKDTLIKEGKNIL